MTAVIVVAEDDADIRGLIELPLRRAGYEVHAVQDGEAALRACVDLRAAAAVLDVQMPKLDGLEVTRRLRAHEATRDIPVLILTASVREAEIAQAFAAGADDFLRKPFSPTELPRRLAVLLEAAAPRG